MKSALVDLATEKETKAALAFVSLLSYVPVASAQEVKTYEIGDVLYLENVDPDVEEIGRKVSPHMRTQNTYFVRG